MQVDLKMAEFPSALLADSNWAELLGLRGAEREALLAACDACALAADEVLFRRGDPAAELYIVVTGRLQVDDAGESKQPIGFLGRGRTVGELGLLTGDARRATVRAVRDTILLRLSRDRFLELGRMYPAMLVETARQIARLVTVPQVSRRRDRPSVLAVVGLGPDAPRRAVVDGITEALGKLGSVRTLRAADGVASLGVEKINASLGTVEHATVARWLLDLEEGHDAVVFDADDGDTAWARLCIRQADSVLLVARGGAAIPRDALADRFNAGSDAHASDRRELVRVWPDDAAHPSGTRAWLDAFPVAAHHHIRLGRKADFARLARRVRGMGVALSLSGGAARGLAHLGVVERLRAHGVPLDHLSGTSMGALFSALAADERDVTDMAEVASWLTKRWFLDATLPYVAALSGRNTEAYLREYFGERAIEDLWLPWFALSSSLSTARAVPLRHGPVVTAMLASSAVPGLFPPVARDGDLLVDGLFTENLPALRAWSEVDGYTIAVNAMPLADRSLWTRLNAPAPTLWGRAVDIARLGAEARLPPVFDLVLYGMFLGAVTEAENLRGKVDVFIQPRVGHIGFLNSFARDEVIALGREAADAEVAAWWKRDPRVRACLGA